ncbi:MAG: NH(3)-dependent NAD(+) synthetase [Firmicutes bacterium]|nr:NH(3)-dependent NAD(+) synthetase [Bacillota bacterium]MBT9157238.1 NH(3)-dependent NAD(+) synthetase [Bacillota bacterium]
METSVVVSKLVAWITKQVESANMQGVIFGLSGGIDSAVVAALAKRAFPSKTLACYLPCHSHPLDREHALLTAETLGIKLIETDLTPIYEHLLGILGHGDDAVFAVPTVSLANIKPRLRMTALYYYASLHSCLVLGTSNLSELTVGYFTKYGDGGVDLMPLAGLVKTQVRELAKYLGVPEVIIAKPPTAGLWAGQTDEGEMGITYKELDEYILTGEADPHVKERVDALAAASSHKKRLPPIPKL